MTSPRRARPEQACSLEVLADYGRTYPSGATLRRHTWLMVARCETAAAALRLANQLAAQCKSSPRFRVREVGS